MSRRLMVLTLVGTLLAAASITAAAQAAPALPLPGGAYAGHSKAGDGKRILVKVRARNGGSGQLRGFVRYPCAGVKARFRTDDGTFKARDRKRGKTIFKVSGRFRGMNKAVGKIKRLSRGLGHNDCRASKFKAAIDNAPRVHQKTVSYGPFPTAPAAGHGGGGGGHNVGRAGLEKPCGDCTLVGMVPELREADGRRANFDTGSMLHHVVFFNQSDQDATCKGWGERFFAAGNERSPFVLPRGYGYEIGSGDDWTLITHLMNMTEHEKDLFIEVTFYYVKGMRELEGVKPFWLDINNCSSSEYETPAGTHTESRDFVLRSGLGGEVVAIGGHLHDHGERIRLKNVTSGETICSAGARYGGDPAYGDHIESVGGCIGRPVAEVRPGETLRLLSRYDAPEALDGVMGIMVGYLAPSG